MEFDSMEIMKAAADSYATWRGFLYVQTHRLTYSIHCRYRCSRYGQLRAKKEPAPGCKTRNRTTFKCGCKHELIGAYTPPGEGGDDKRVYLTAVKPHSNGCSPQHAAREVALRRKGMTLTPAVLNALAGIVESGAGGKVALSLRTYLNRHPCGLAPIRNHYVISLHGSN